MSTPSSTTTTTEIKLTPEQEKLLKPVIPIAEEYIANPPKLPDYSQIAPFNPVQLGAQKQLLNSAGGQQKVVNQGAASNAFLLNPDILSPESNPALEATINAAINPIQQQLFTETLPLIGTSSEMSGQYGGTTQGIAEGLAAQGAQQAAVNVAAPIANAGYQSGLDAMTKALALNPQTAAALTLPATSVGAVGDVRQAMSQAQLSEKAYTDVYNQIAPFLAAQEVAALAAGIPGGGTEATTTGGTATSNPITGALGGLSLAAGLGASSPMTLGLGGILGGLAAFL